MFHRLSALCVLLLLAIPAGAHAEGYPPGRQLHHECERAQRLRLADPDGSSARDALALDAGLCLGLLQGIGELNEQLAEPLFCPPQGAPLGEAVVAVIAYLKRHPEQPAESKTALAVAALRERYPCRQ
jgi:hypothetical protein